LAPQDGIQDVARRLFQSAKDPTLDIPATTRKVRKKPEATAASRTDDVVLKLV
jgi:hypothetical protein